MTASSSPRDDHREQTRDYRREQPQASSTISSTSSPLSSTGGNFVIRPPTTGNDDGTPSDSILNDVRRVLAMIQDERHLVAFELYKHVKHRMERMMEQQQPQEEEEPIHKKNRLLFLPTTRHHPHHQHHVRVSKRTAKENEQRAAQDLFYRKQADFETLENRARLFTKAKQTMNDTCDWIFSQTMFGITTHYKKESDDSLSIKLEGNLEGVPLFEQVAVLREVDLHSKWAPCCSSSMMISQLDKLDVVGWFVTGLPAFGILRDGCFRAIGCDAMQEDGCILLVGQGVADRKDEENNTRAKNTTTTDDDDDVYLSEDPILTELDIPPIPTRMGTGRMTIRKFEAVIDILSPTCAQTKIVANIDPHLDFLPHSLIDFIMKKLCGVLLSKLQAAAKKIAKDPVKNAHARRMRRDEFYSEWLVPKFQEFCQLRGWTMPRIAALELTEEQQEQAFLLDDVPSTEHPFRMRSFDEAAEHDGVGFSRHHAAAGGGVMEEEPSLSGISELSTMSSSAWRNNPVANYMRELEAKTQMKKAQKVAKERRRAAKRLKPKKFSQDQEARLKELKEMKARRLQDSNDMSTREHLHSTEENEQQDGDDVPTVPERKTKRSLMAQLYKHDKKTRWFVMSVLVTVMYVLLYANVDSSSGGFLKAEASSWSGELLRDVGTILYLGVCALTHFCLSTVALAYAFESLDLGTKAGRRSKQYYSDLIFFGAAAASGSMVAVSIAKALVTLWVGSAIWYTLQISEYLQEVMAPLSYSNLSGTVTNKVPAVSFVVSWIETCVSWVTGTSFYTMWLTAHFSVACLDFFSSHAIRSYWIGRAVEDLVLYIVNLFLSGRLTWNAFVSEVVASREGTIVIPTWRSNAIDTSRLFLTYSSVFLLTLLFLFHASKANTKKGGRKKRSLRFRNSEEESEDSSAASTTEDGSASSSAVSWQMSANERCNSAPQVRHEVIHEGNEEGEQYLDTAASSAVPSDMTSSAVGSSTPSRRVRFRPIKKLRFRRKKRRESENGSNNVESPPSLHKSGTF